MDDLTHDFAGGSCRECGEPYGADTRKAYCFVRVDRALATRDAARLAVGQERDAYAANLTRERQALAAIVADLRERADDLNWDGVARSEKARAGREAAAALRAAADAYARGPVGSALDALLAQARLEGHRAGLEEAATVADGVAAEHERLMWQAREDLEFDLRDEHSSANNGARDAAAAIRAHLPEPR